MRNNSNPNRSVDEKANKIKYCPYDGYKFQTIDTFCFICK
jgi:hypothetical protein